MLFYSVSIKNASARHQILFISSGQDAANNIVTCLQTKLHNVIIQFNSETRTNYTNAQNT